MAGLDGGQHTVRGSSARNSIACVLLLWSWITLMISCMHIHPFPQVLDE